MTDITRIKSCSDLFTFFLLATNLGSIRSMSSTKNNVHVVPSRGNALHPTLVLIGGMAQTKASWEHHLPSLCKNRKVVVYECIGQGNVRSSDLQNVSLPFQAQALLEVIKEEEEAKVDLVGFSFGARVAMATACLAEGPDFIRKLHLSGVATDRSDYGHLAVQAWKDCVQNDPSLRSFAWSVLMATYSSRFLRTQPIDRYIDHICNTNSRDGLLALLEQAEVTDHKNHWHVANMAERIQKSGIPGKVCVGELDQMAPKENARELCEKLGWAEPLISPKCGHAVGIEGARIWKNDVLEFLNV
jgi:pimeloyl-ACP methyl ester carboxylesterase